MAFVERVFSGVQPTGNLHLGNYLGAIVNFVKLQETHNCIYCVVDMHAITQAGGRSGAARPSSRATPARSPRPSSPAGIDPKKHIVFNQSQVLRTRRAGLDLQLRGARRLAQPHDAVQGKGRQGPRGAHRSGLYDYPVLMAADILRLSRHPCAGRRGPEAAPRTVARHRAEIQQ